MNGCLEFLSNIYVIGVEVDRRLKVHMSSVGFDLRYDSGLAGVQFNGALSSAA
jgi:hypothetical protein